MYDSVGDKKKEKKRKIIVVYVFSFLHFSHVSRTDRAGGSLGGRFVFIFRRRDVLRKAPRERLVEMNFFRGVMGGQAAGPQPSGAETVGDQPPASRG